eukprot:2262967-Ditylum_brightwellii.AAC.1
MHQPEDGLAPFPHEFWHDERSIDTLPLEEPSPALVVDPLSGIPWPVDQHLGGPFLECLWWDCPYHTP